MNEHCGHECVCRGWDVQDDKEPCYNNENCQHDTRERSSATDHDLKMFGCGLLTGIAFILLVVFVTGYNFAGQAQCL